MDDKSRRFNAREICWIFGVPPKLVATTNWRDQLWWHYMNIRHPIQWWKNNRKPVIIFVES